MRTGRVIGTIGIGVTALVGAFTIVGALLPNSYTVERSIAIQAPPGTVFEQIIDLQNHRAWNPWKARDPSMAWSFGESRRGAGALYTWTSDDSGEGTYTITAADAPSRIETSIAFEGMGASDGTFMLEPIDGGTEVTWAFTGTNPGILGAYVTLAMDPFVGPDVEDGLARLKQVAEAAPPPRPPIRSGRVRGAATFSPGGHTILLCDEDTPRALAEPEGPLVAPFLAQAAESQFTVFADVEAVPHEGAGVAITRVRVLSELPPGGPARLPWSPGWPSPSGPGPCGPPAPVRGRSSPTSPPAMASRSMRPRRPAQDSHGPVAPRAMSRWGSPSMHRRVPGRRRG